MSKLKLVIKIDIIMNGEIIQSNGVTCLLYFNFALKQRCFCSVQLLTAERFVESIYCRKRRTPSASILNVAVHFDSKLPQRSRAQAQKQFCNFQAKIACFQSQFCLQKVNELHQQGRLAIKAKKATVYPVCQQNFFFNFFFFLWNA